MEQIIIKDDFLIRLKLLEIVLAVVVGGVVFSLMKPEEYTSPAAIPMFGVLSLVFLDGLMGYLVIWKGIEIDNKSRRIRFPYRYRRKTIQISEIKDIKTTFKTSRDKDFRTHYTYYLVLYGDFGKKRLTFKSEEIRNRVFQAIEGLMNEKVTRTHTT